MAEKFLHRVVYAGNRNEVVIQQSEVIVHPGLLNQIPKILKRRAPQANFAFLTDRNVMSLYGEGLLENMKNQRMQVSKPIIIEPGEQSKNGENYLAILSELARREADRNTQLLILGGGVIGDIGGFAAASYKRGIDYYQIPTTLLADADSSIGGKVGINIPEGKNLAGSYYFPKGTFIDPNVLNTLTDGEIRSGLAEIIKCGVLDVEILTTVEDNLTRLLAKNPRALGQVISKCVDLKTNIVELDLKDQDIRQSLNFGHTVGHALERLTNFELSHGEAVAIGMIQESKLAVLKQRFSQANLDRLIAIVSKTGLPTLLPTNINTDQLVAIMRNDKKNANGQINFAIPPKFGQLDLYQGFNHISLPENQIREILLDSSH